MCNLKNIEKFADLIIKVGVNLQKGQGLEIMCPVEKYEIAKVFAQSAYRAGAGIVQVRWNYEDLDVLNYLNARTEKLMEVPKWIVESKNYLVDNNFCYIAIASENPMAFNNVSPEKLALVSKAKSKAMKKFSDNVMENAIRWCVVSVPAYEWAKQVCPDAEDPETELWEKISKTMRLEYDDPVKEWQKHIAKLKSHAEYLNKMDFEYLHFENSLGTDIMVGLADNHVWLSAEENAKDGVPFVANMPTEEVFTAPHTKKIDGIVKSAMPLCYNGKIIDKFSLTFKKGKIVDFSAETGYETLAHLIDTDKGTKSIGEIALIGKNSPVAMSKTLFFNTLFDENASCHMAIGKAYPTTVQNGEQMTLNQLKAKGANDSIEHVDFMIGTSDLEVTGIRHNGEKIQIFHDGEWIIQ